MKNVSIEGFNIKIAPNKTASFYKDLPTKADIASCGCRECTNFVKACDLFNFEVTNFFLNLGIDPRKEVELIHCCQNDDGSHLYQGFYHFVGEVTAETDEFIIGNFTFAITNAYLTSAGVPNDFPQPVCELSFQANIPWVLNEPFSC